MRTGRNQKKVLQPTNNLRFVEREVQEPASTSDPNIVRITKVRILQQLWISDSNDVGEWSDVPVEKEQ